MSPCVFVAADSWLGNVFARPGSPRLLIRATVRFELRSFKSAARLFSPKFREAAAAHVKALKDYDAAERRPEAVERQAICRAPLEKSAATLHDAVKSASESLRGEGLVDWTTPDPREIIVYFSRASGVFLALDCFSPFRVLFDF